MFQTPASAAIYVNQQLANAWSASVCRDIKDAGSLGSTKEAQELLKAQPNFRMILVKCFSCVRKKGIEAFRDGRTLDEIAL